MPDYILKYKDLIGKNFGFYKVIKIMLPNTRDNPSKGCSAWCECQCGNERRVCISVLRRGESRSCGCRRYDWCTTHGKTNSKTYHSWSSMRVRCRDETHVHYDRYGGRGITVCEEWDNSFESFYKDMGERPQGKSLDRIDNNLGYFKENCKWSTPKEQLSNTSRTNPEIGISINCFQCGAVFIKTTPSRILCGRSCYHLSRSKKKEITKCLWCANNFEQKKAGQSNRKTFCSVSCAKRHLFSLKIERKENK